RDAELETADLIFGDNYRHALDLVWKNKLCPYHLILRGKICGKLDLVESRRGQEGLGPHRLRSLHLQELRYLKLESRIVGAKAHGDDDPIAYIHSEAGGVRVIIFSFAGFVHLVVAGTNLPDSD